MEWRFPFRYLAASYSFYSLIWALLALIASTPNTVCVSTSLKDRRIIGFAIRPKVKPCNTLPTQMLSGTLHVTQTPLQVATITDLPHYIQDAAVQCFGETFRHVEPQLHLSSRLHAGDFQCTLPFTIAKTLQLDPLEVSRCLAATLRCNKKARSLGEIVAHTKGFLNIRMNSDFVISEIMRMNASNDGRLGIPILKDGKRVVIDYSSPNLVKPLHAGHLRSISIGDSIARLLEFIGHTVLRISHVGDWGLQYGMLLAYLHSEMPRLFTNSSEFGLIREKLSIGTMEHMYQAANHLYATDSKFRDEAHRMLIKLQHGDAQITRTWKALCAISRSSIEGLYKQLNIKDLVEIGESFYNSSLSEMLSILHSKDAIVDVQGTTCIKLPLNDQGNASILALQRRDGTYLYAATDLAALMYRSKTQKADRVLYVVDSSQALHLKQVFTAARVFGLVPSDMELKHVSFGFISSSKGKKLMTRSGGVVKLKDLLDNATQMAEAWLMEKESTHIDSGEELKEASRIVGIGGVKYNDLSMNRNTNYKISFSKMLNLSGNTVTYLLYALARIKGILQIASKTNHESASLDFDIAEAFQLSQRDEINLAKHIIKFPLFIDGIAKSFQLHKLCLYLYNLSKLLNRFYEACPVNNLTVDSTNRYVTHQIRITLCKLTQSILELGLNILGIQTVRRL